MGYKIGNFKIEMELRVQELEKYLQKLEQRLIETEHITKNLCYFIEKEKQEEHEKLVHTQDNEQCLRQCMPYEVLSKSKKIRNDAGLHVWHRQRCIKCYVVRGETKDEYLGSFKE